MSRVPAVTPDGAKIGQLIWDRGYSRAGFARQLRFTRGAKSIYNIISTNQRSSVELVREIARVLGVSYEEIILRDDDSEPEALASLDAKNGPAAANDRAGERDTLAPHSNRRDTPAMGYAGYTPPEQDIRAADGQPYATGKDEPHGGPYAPITRPEATR